MSSEAPTITDDCPVCGGRVERPLDVMAALAAAPEAIANALTQAPAAPSGWDPHFVALHLADLEISRGWRFRQILAEDNPAIGALDQEKYADQLSYSERDLALALANFASNRAANVELLQLAGEAALTRPYRHVVVGPMTLGQLVNHTTHHDQAHLRQIRGE